MATAPIPVMNSKAIQVASQKLASLRGRDPNEVVTLEGVRYFLWQTLVKEVQAHIDLVYAVEGRQL